MPRRIASAAIVITTLTVFVLAFGGAAGATRHRLPPVGGALIRSNPQRALPERGGTVRSANWSGYAVTPGGGRVTSVTSTFTVPVAGLLLPGFAATWAGIGGYNTTDLIQAGVAEQSLPSNPVLGNQYFAWYELLPGVSIPLTNCSGSATCTVNSGNVVAVNIAQIAGSDDWTVSVADEGHWTWTKTVTYASSRTSAEWILEAPQVEGLQSLLAGVGSAHFGPFSSFTVDGGSPQTIAQGNPTQIDLTSPLGLFTLAVPSPLAADGQSFDVCAYDQSCAAP